MTSFLFRILPLFLFDLILLNTAKPQSWSAVSIGFNDCVNSLYSDTSSGYLFAGGEFTHSGQLQLHSISRYNGNIWVPYGNGFDGAHPVSIYSVFRYHDSLYAGGNFTSFYNSIDAGAYISLFVSNNWSALYDTAVWPNSSAVLSLNQFNDELIIAGYSQNAVQAIKRTGSPGCNNCIVSRNFTGINSPVLCTYSTDSVLYAGCLGTTGVTGINVMQCYDSVFTWPSGPNTMLDDGVRTLTMFNGELIAGGFFRYSDSLELNYIAKWNGNSWQPMGPGFDNAVNSLTIYNGNLYAGGYFTMSGSNSCEHIAKWNGVEWISVAGGTDGEVQALCVHNNALYAGGCFAQAGGISVSHIAKYSETIGVKENNILSNVKVFYNSFNNSIAIKFDNSLQGNINGCFKLLNTYGQIINKVDLNSNSEQQIKISELSAGIYYYKIDMNNNINLSGRIFIY